MSACLVERNGRLRENALKFCKNALKLIVRRYAEINCEEMLQNKEVAQSSNVVVVVM